MNTHNTHPLPTMPQLIKATGLALLVAGVILITTVLPAEHGIDPTGIGKALGLTTLSGSGRPPPHGFLLLRRQRHPALQRKLRRVATRQPQP